VPEAEIYANLFFSHIQDVDVLSASFKKFILQKQTKFYIFYGDTCAAKVSVENRDFL